MVGALVWMLAGRAAIAAPSRWSVTPPPGWSDESAAALQRPQTQSQQQTLARTGGTLELAEYHGPDGSVLAVVFMTSPSERDDGSGVDGFAHGAHDSVAALGADKSYTRREDGNVLVVDEVVAGPKGDVRMKLMAGITRTQLRGLSATCIAPEAVCATALRSLTLDRDELVTLHGTSRSSSYQQGRQVGRIAAIIAVVLFSLRFVLRSRKKRAAA